MVTADEASADTHQMEAATEDLLEGSSEASIAVLKRPDDVKKIEELWTEGFKLFVGQDFEAASEKLSQATELSVDLYGQFASQGYQPHYYYGRAMIEIARAEYLVVKPPVAEEDEEDSSSDEEQENETGNAGLTNDNDHVSKHGGNGESTATEDVDAAKVIAAENIEKQSEPDEIEDQIDEQTLRTEDGEDADELTAGKLAWESLEVARSICDKQEQTDEWLEKKADVLIALGECMLVDENFGNALDEFKTALEIQKRIFEPNHRRISETLFHIGLAYKNNNDFENAAASFDKAAKVFENIIENMTKNSDENDPVAASDITELKKILADIKEQTQDARESAESCKKQLNDQKAMITNVFAETLKSVIGADKADDVPVNDISGMIQRKSVKRPACSTDATTTTTTNTESTEGPSIEAISAESLPTSVDQKFTSDKQLEVKKAKLDEGTEEGPSLPSS